VAPKIPFIENLLITCYNSRLMKDLDTETLPLGLDLDSLPCVVRDALGSLASKLYANELELLDGLKAGRSIEGSPISREEMLDGFTRVLDRRSPKPNHVAVGPESTITITGEDGQEDITVLDFAAREVVKYIAQCVKDIESNRPTPPKAIGPVLRVLRQIVALDTLEEREDREIREDEDHRFTEAQKKAQRDRSLSGLNRMLGALRNDPGGLMASKVTQEKLLEAIKRLQTDADVPKRTADPVAVRRPGRVDRLRAYIPKRGRTEEKTVVISETKDEKRHGEVAGPHEVVKEETRPVKIRVDWLDENNTVTLEATRYSGEIELDLIYALSPFMQDIANSIDRNPYSEDGLDRYQAIVDRLAKAIAEGNTPRKLNFVKPLRGKERKDYPNDIWYTFKQSPNSPRIYFAYRVPEFRSDPNKVHQLIILSETDKAHQLRAMQRMMGLQRRRLKNRNAGSQ
jgi:hypothetical protein